MHAEESLLPSKTEEFDVSVPLDLQRQAFLIPLLQCLCVGLPPGAAVWSFGYEQWRAAFHSA
eukprot:4988029-Lingulodinium_polyedra.AAC.1